MMRPAIALIALFAVLQILAPPLHAQDAPRGACLLPSGEWCWPIAPLTYGDPCECPMPDGTFVAGVVQ